MHVPGDSSAVERLESVSVSVSFSLPESNVAPSVVEYIPLHGDGYSAPHSAFYGNAQVVGDASGGTATMLVGKDERFSHLIQFLSPEVLAATAEPFEIRIGRSDKISYFVVGVMPVSTVLGSALSTTLYTPPPMIDPNSWAFETDNTTGVVNRLKFLVYNFKIDAHLKVPLPVLLASLPRSASLI